MKKYKEKEVSGQTIIFHRAWLERWLKAQQLGWEEAKTIYPIYMEISPSNICNHNCLFCGLDFARFDHHQKGAVSLSEDRLREAITDAAAGGVKSIMYAGEGEPCLYPRMAEVVVFTKEAGIDVSLTTNGALLSKDFLKKAMGSLSWIRVSIDAGTEATHQAIHRPRNKKNDLERIFSNLDFAVRLKNAYGYACRLDGQMLLLPPIGDAPGNVDEVLVLAIKLKSTGIDLFVVKPYSHHTKSQTDVYEKVSSYADYLKLEKDLKKLADDDFHIIFRSYTMRKYSKNQPYNVCQAIPFAMAYISAEGDVYACSPNLSDPRFCLGNINQQSFKEIWEGDRRRQHWEFIKQMSLEGCRRNCHLDEVNRFLWELARQSDSARYLADLQKKAGPPPINVNFI